MILDRLLGPRQPLSEEALAYKFGSWRMSETPGVLYAGGSQTASGQRVDEESALSLSAVFAGVWLLSQVVGMLPRTVYRRDGRSRSEATTHPAYRCLRIAPNPEMTVKTWAQLQHFHRLLWGASCSEIEWAGNSTVRNLWPIEPWRVRPERRDGKLGYLVDGKRWVAGEDMLYVPLISFDGIAGCSFVKFALESLGLSMSEQEFAARFFGNGTRPGGILRHPGNPNPKARGEMRDDWTRNHGSADNSHRVGVLWGGWEYQRDGGVTPPAESQLLEARKFGIEEVARWLNLPPHLLRDMTRSTFNNIEEQGIQFVVYTLLPVLVDYEQEYDRKLLAPPDLFCKHAVSALMRGNAIQRSQFYREMFGVGGFSPNDILEFEDMDPVKGGDKRFIPANMVELVLAGTKPAPLPSQAGDMPPNPTGPGSNDKPGGGKMPAKGQPKGAPPIGGIEAGMAVADAHRELLCEAAGRVLRKEANAARRAAKSPGRFLEWLDEFYPAHQALTSLALAPPVRAVLAMRGESESAADLARQTAAAWVSRSRAALLDIAGACQPAELEEAVTSLCEVWQRKRPAELAAEIIMEEVDHAEDHAAAA